MIAVQPSACPAVVLLVRLEDGTKTKNARGEKGGMNKKQKEGTNGHENDKKVKQAHDKTVCS